MSSSDANPRHRQRSGRLIALTVGAVATAAAVIIVGVLIASGSGGAATTTTPGFNPVGASAAPTTTKSGLSSSPPFVTQQPGTQVAVVLHPTPMRATPGGAVLHQLGARTEFGSPEVMWVVRTSGAWLGVVSPLAGNGRLGWIPADAASLNRITWELKVSLSARRLTVLDNGKVVERYTVAVGAPGSPTPTGRFAVTDRLLTGDPTGPYGCCILALSAHSPHAIQGWTGGDRIAIHSTPDTTSIGQAVSHGCMRLTLAEGRWLMNHVPLGTPTLISS